MKCEIDWENWICITHWTGLNRSGLCPKAGRKPVIPALLALFMAGCAATPQYNVECVNVRLYEVVGYSWEPQAYEPTNIKMQVCDKWELKPK